jgi:hypothetical protein
MLTSTVYSLGDPGTFDITDKDDPLYYVARYSHEMSVNLYNLSEEEFEYRQSEIADYSDFTDAMDTYTGAFITWLEGAVAAQENETAVPALPTLPTLPSLPIPGIVTQIMIRIVLQLIGNYIKKRFDGGTATGEMVALLKKALLDSSGDSLLYLLHAVPIEIILSRIGEYQDFLYTDGGV